MNSSRRSFSCMCLITTLLIVTGSSNGQQVSTSSLYPSYSSYSSPSAVSQSDGSGSVKNNVPDVGLNSVGGSSTGGIVGNGGEEGQRSATNSGYIPQGSHSMYYYEMYPSPAKQKCTYGKGGMKCQYRRDSGAGHDSYSAAAAESPSSSYGAPSDSYGAPMMPGGYGGGGGGWGSGEMEEEEKGGGGGSIGGLAGLIGLLGLKGLKGLKALPPLALLLPLLPILLPILLPLLIIGPILPLLLLLFIPIPVIVTPGRNLVEGSSVFENVGVSSVAAIAKEVIQSEECVERISCEIAVRASKSYYFGAMVDKVSGYLPPNSEFTKRMLKGINNNKSESKSGNSKEESGARSFNKSGSERNCAKFVCKPRNVITKHFVK